MSVNIWDGENLVPISGGGGVEVDSELSETSNNPVQNKVIAGALQTALLARGALHGINIDTLFTAGVWKTTADGTGTYPTSEKTGSIIVLSANEHCIQIFFKYSGDMYTRVYAGQWYDWRKIKFET